ncbi:MAG TPA: 50S ribosomal protein L30 [Anaerolineales bacterium]|nr:50S ribosomal protein L30 [Anaerolineales bacterium]
MAKRKVEKRIRITLVRSPIGYSLRQKRTVRALGLRRMHQSVEQNDGPVVRGMIAKVEHLVAVEELAGDEAA